MSFTARTLLAPGMIPEQHLHKVRAVHAEPADTAKRAERRRTFRLDDAAPPKTAPAPAAEAPAPAST
ncbi:hypothetical protein L6R52_39750 [Myxococcota bacterium]|nr:hypothetical protein [Myxococcota bacterium]